MALRKAAAYSKKGALPYTRTSARKGKAYIKTVPGNKVVKFHIGNQKDYDAGKHTYFVSLITEEGVMIRDSALESARMHLTKMLDTEALGLYYLKVCVFPHHLMRENKSAGGMAGADRISTGMTQAFGIVIGRAALCRPGQVIYFISAANEKTARIARKALQTVKAKLPCRTKILFEQPLLH